MSNRTCEHIQDDGLRCPNPAMYRRQICFHHWRLLRASAPVCDPAYVPPTFDCEASVSLMTAHILRCVLAGKIDIKRAQVAMTCVRETAKSLRLQGKVGNGIETSFTAFMADYFSALDEIQAKSAAAFPDPQPLIYPAHFADIPEDDDADSFSSRAPAAGLSSRARVAGEGSASCSKSHDTADHGERAGLQPRVTELEGIGALAPVAPLHKPLSTTQTKLLRKILRRGPKHPQFHLAARLLDRQITRGHD